MVQFTFFRTFLKLLLVVLLSVNGTVVSAQQTPPSASADYTTRVNEKEQKAEVIDSKTNQVVAEIPYSSDEKLKDQSLKKLVSALANSKVGKPAIKVWNAADPLATAGHVITQFPAETGLFLISIGAGVALETVLSDTAYGKNPLAIEQQLQSQLGPLGMTGFALFMYSSRITNNMLNAWFKGKYQSFIPYAGMSVGFYAQSLFSEMAMDPNFQMCIKALVNPRIEQVTKVMAMAMGVDVPAPCEEAFSYHVLKKRIWTSAPGLVSMLGAMLMSGATQSLIRGGLIRLTGFDLMMLMIPGGVARYGLKAVVAKGLQVYSFYFFDQKVLHKPVAWVWNNFFQGRDFATLNDELLYVVLANQQEGWKTNRLLYMMAALEEFSTKMKEWRDFNLLPVYEAHNNWQAALNNLMSDWRLSKIFYTDWINEIRGARFPQLGQINRIDQSFPTFDAYNEDSTNNRIYWDSPKESQLGQIETFYTRGKMIEYALNNGGPEDVNPKDKELLKVITKQFLSKDVQQIAKALDTINGILYPKTSIQINLALNNYLKKIKDAVGENAQNKTAIGSGFLELYKRHGTEADSLNQIDMDEIIGTFRVRHPAEKYLITAVCGPRLSIDSTFIETTKGFPSRFSPPRLIPQWDSPALDRVCKNIEHRSSFYSIDKFFGFTSLVEIPKKLQIQDGPQTYSNLFLLVKDYIEPFILGPAQSDQEQTSFEYHWERSIESSVQKAFLEFARYYEKIVQMMAATYFTRDYSKQVFQQYQALPQFNKSTFNQGPVANTVMDSIFQEMRLYSLILGEIYRNTYQADMKATIPISLLSQKLNSKLVPSSNELQQDSASFLSLLSQDTTPLDLGAIAQQAAWQLNTQLSQRNYGATAKGPATTVDQRRLGIIELFKKSEFYPTQRNFYFQDRLEYHFKMLKYLYIQESERLRLRRATMTAEKPLSDDKKPLTQTLEQLTEDLNKIIKLFVMKKTTRDANGKEESTFLFNQGQQMLVGLIVKKIDALARELALSVSVTQALDWEGLMEKTKDIKNICDKNQVEVNGSTGRNTKATGHENCKTE